jgi:hypothetical protein
MAALTIYSHEDSRTFRIYLANKINSLKKKHKDILAIAELCNLGLYADDVWIFGVALSKEPLYTKHYHKLNANLLKASAIFNIIKSVIVAKIAMNYPDALEDVNDILQFTNDTISRYFVPGLYDIEQYQALSHLDLSIDKLENWKGYITTQHSKVKDLSMVIKDGYYIQSDIVKSFCPIEFSIITLYEKPIKDRTIKFPARKETRIVPCTKAKNLTGSSFISRLLYW